MILKQIIGHRVLISTGGNPRPTLARVESIDDTFIAISTEAKEKTNQLEIVPRVTTYLALGAIDTITDINDETTYGYVMGQLEAAATAAKEAAKKSKS